MRISREIDEITIRHLPVGNWTLGIGALTVIVGFCFWLFRSENNSTSLWGDLLYSLFWLLVLTVVLYLSVFDFASSSGILSPATSIRVNVKELFVEVIETRIYGRKVTRRYFYQMDRFRSYKAKRFLWTEYFLSLRLRKGRYLKFLVPLGQNKAETTKLVKELNKFVQGTKK